MNFCADQLLLYAVTDRAWVGRQTLLEQIEDALRGGVTMVQLREKELPEDAFTAEAMEVKALCHRYGVPLLIDDNVDVALKSGADGVHVGIEDTPVAEIRARAGRDFIIGSTAKTVEQARAAQAAGVMPKLICKAPSTWRIMSSLSWPTGLRRRLLSMVLTCSSRTTESLGNPLSPAGRKMWVGMRVFPKREVMAAAITVGP